MLLVTMPFVQMPMHAPLALLSMFLLSAGSLAVLGMIAGIVAEKFDHIATFTNFFITPLSFLSGVFYSVHALSPIWFKARSEEHTSELQSLMRISYAVFCLKKK